MAPPPAPPVKIWQCDPGEVDDACLNPTLVTLSVPVSSALRTRVALLLDQMVQATIDDTAVPAPAVELLQVASLPLYKILTVQAAYSRGIASDDRATLAEITSVDLLFAILDQLTSELGKSKSAFIGADQDRIAQWQAQLATPAHLARPASQHPGPGVGDHADHPAHRLHRERPAIEHVAVDVGEL
jgi:conjugative transfer pilus assembly protein TraH